MDLFNFKVSKIQGEIMIVNFDLTCTNCTILKQYLNQMYINALH